ncbi:hypothetical protein T484DRAFT_1815397 [Baffinella frigidus]|nr:hypothetical protein T484DRAFT_1815397 [Cryptophyta sp. CCMP2293]
MATGKLTLAIRAYWLAARLAPKEADTLFNLGVLLLRVSAAERSPPRGWTLARDAAHCLARAARLRPGDRQLADAAAHARQALAARVAT